MERFKVLLDNLAQEQLSYQESVELGTLLMNEVQSANGKKFLSTLALGLLNSKVASKYEDKAEDFMHTIGLIA